MVDGFIFSFAAGRDISFTDCFVCTCSAVMASSVESVECLTIGLLLFTGLEIEAYIGFRVLR